MDKSQNNIHFQYFRFLELLFCFVTQKTKHIPDNNKIVPFVSFYTHKKNWAIKQSHCIIFRTANPTKHTIHRTPCQRTTNTHLALFSPHSYYATKNILIYF